MDLKILLLPVPFIVIIIAFAMMIVILGIVFWRKSTSPISKQPKSAKKDETNAEETVSNAHKQELIKTQPSGTFKTSSSEPVPLANTVRTLLPDERPAGVKWQVVGQTDVGLKRELNEDNFEMIETTLPDTRPCGLYVVADGMGGHEGGEIASHLTVTSIKQYFSECPPLSETTTFKEWLEKAVSVANETVVAQQDNRDHHDKMGSTVVMAVVVDQQAHISHVGDSRAYILNNTIKRITVDHSLVERLIEIGQITAEEARTHPQRNVIYSTIGVNKPRMDIGFYQVDLQPGDRLLLCSDGLSGLVDDEDLLKLSQSYADPAVVCQVMIESAKRAGGYDNITAVIVQMDK